MSRLADKIRTTRHTFRKMKLFPRETNFVLFVHKQFGTTGDTVLPLVGNIRGFYEQQYIFFI